MRLSIVTPCFNEANNVAELHRHLDSVAAQIDGEVEFVFVDDGSRDDTFDRLKALADEDPRIRVLALSRNFGHQAALSAGMDHASGEAVVVMDADLQHPPELIPELVAKWREGYDLVYAYREGVKPRLGYRLLHTLPGSLDLSLRCGRGPGAPPWLGLLRFLSDRLLSGYGFDRLRSNPLFGAGILRLGDRRSIPLVFGFRRSCRLGASPWCRLGLRRFSHWCLCCRCLSGFHRCSRFSHRCLRYRRLSGFRRCSRFSYRCLC